MIRAQPVNSEPMNASTPTTRQFSWREALLSSPAVAVGVFCIGLLTCTGVGLAVIATQAAKGSSSLDVTGVSSQLITSDRVKWSFKLKNTSKNRIEGAKTQQKQLDKALAFLQANQISEDDISIKVLLINPNSENKRLRVEIANCENTPYNYESVFHKMMTKMLEDACLHWTTCKRI